MRESLSGKILAGLIVALLAVTVTMLHDLRTDIKDLRSEINNRLNVKLDKAVFRAYLRLGRYNAKHKED